MHARRVKTWLQIAGSGLSVAAVGVLVWSLFWPIEKSPVTVSQPVTQSASRKVQRPVLPTLKQFEPFWKRQMRRPLFDPPPNTPVASSATVQKPPSSLGVRLLGTVTEPGRSVAMLMTTRGTIEIKAVGERLGDMPDGAEVVSVNTDRAVLRYHGETISLELESEKKR
jgi:hypothetical protein